MPSSATRDGCSSGTTSHRRRERTAYLTDWSSVGTSTLVREVLDAGALRALAGLPMRELYDLPDPKRDVLETALRRGRSVRIELDEATPGGVS